MGDCVTNYDSTTSTYESLVSDSDSEISSVIEQRFPPSWKAYFNKLVCFDQFLGDLQGWRDERGSLLEGLLVFSDKIFGQYESQSWAFGNLKEDNNFADVTLACEDGQQVEAHKVILAEQVLF